MFGLLFLLFVVLPLVELFLIVQVAGGIGIGWTIGLLLTISVLGAWLVRREGTGVVTRIREQLFGGQLPNKEIADGALIMFGGTLLLTPGFLTDALGLSLMIPPIRAVVRGIVLKRVEARAETAKKDFVFQATQRATQKGAGFGSSAGAARGFGFGSAFGRDVIDVDVVRADQQDNARFELPTDSTLSPQGSVDDTDGVMRNGGAT